MAMTNTTQHPKFKRLKRRLGIGVAQTLGHLECLWQFTHSTGQPVYDKVDIEAVCEWDGEDGVLLSALISDGWLDMRDDGLVEVHDYWKNCPKFVLDRIRKQATRADMSQTRRGQVADIPRNGAQNRTEENRTEENRTDTDPPYNPPIGGTEQVDFALDSQPAPKPETDLDRMIRELPIFWNEQAAESCVRPGLTRIACKAGEAPTLIGARVKRLKARVRDSKSVLGLWRDAIRGLANSPHHCGQNKRGWRADVDFLFQPGRIEQFADKWAALGDRTTEREGDEDFMS